MGKNIAVITGGSSGLGREFARILNHTSEIEEIWAIARHENKLDLLKKELGKKIVAYSFDLSQKENLRLFQQILEKHKYCIKYLINCAGFAKFGSFRDISIHTALNMIDLNCRATVAMTLICLPYMKNESHIINISSSASFQPLPYLNIYSATKAFIYHYSRALYMELKGTGITVTTVCPGWMDTPLIPKAKTGAKKEVWKFTGITSPHKVAKKALKDANRNKTMSIYGLYVKTIRLLTKILPDKLAMKIWLRQQDFL